MMSGSARRVFHQLGRVALCLFIGGTLSSSFGQQRSLPFASGEELIYQAEFNKSLLRGIDVAEFRFSVESVPVISRSIKPEGDAVLHLVGDVVSKGFFPKIAGFRFHQHVETTVDPNQFAVLTTNKLDEQGKRVRVSEAVFDHDARKVTWVERDPNQTEPLRTIAAEFPEPIQDVLSVVYFLRTQPLVPGKSYEVPLSDSGRVYRFTVAVRERRRISTALGRLNAVRVEPAMFGPENVIRAKGSLSIWISDDSRRLPLRAQLKVDIGTFEIKLKKVSYRGTKQPD